MSRAHSKKRRITSEEDLLERMVDFLDTKIEYQRKTGVSPTAQIISINDRNDAARELNKRLGREYKKILKLKDYEKGCTDADCTIMGGKRSTRRTKRYKKGTRRTRRH